MSDIVKQLRAMTEDDVAAALDGSYVSVPLEHTADLLEFFQRMVDRVVGEDDD